jgi:ABC-type transporter Mla subunit MlaD
MDNEKKFLDKDGLQTHITQTKKYVDDADAALKTYAKGLADAAQESIKAVQENLSETQTDLATTQEDLEKLNFILSIDYDTSLKFDTTDVIISSESGAILDQAILG